MDFDSAENWGVEQTASDLDRSLFGTLNGFTGNKQKTKKRKLKTEQVADDSSRVKKSKNNSSVNKIIQSESLSGDTDGKNLSKKRKKRLKDKKRKLMKKKQKLQTQDSETFKKTSDGSKQNKNTDENLNVKKLDQRDGASVQKENKKKKQKLESDHDSGNKEKQISSEKTKIKESDSLSGDTDSKNLSKKRKMRLKDRQRKLMKKKQKLQTQDGEAINKTADSSKQNKNTDENFNVKNLDKKDSESVQKEKKKQKMKSDHDSGNKEKQFSEKTKKKEAMKGEKHVDKGSPDNEIMKNNKSFNKNEKDKQGLSGNRKKQKVDVKNHVENPSTDNCELQISENLKPKKKKKKRRSKNKSSIDTLKSNSETELHQDSSNISKQLAKGKTSNSEKLNFSQIKTPDTKIGQKRFNITELKSVLLKDSLKASVSESAHTKDGNFKSKKFKKSRNENEHRNQAKGKKVESPVKDKQENKVKGKKGESQVEDKLDNQVKGKKVVLSLKERMTEQLKSARFRYLNEQLYTQTSQSAYKMFQGDKEAFQVYHDGFQGQVSKWPVNPVDVIISYIKNKPKQLVVADFGCGDAKISQNVPNKVHSFDLVAVNKHVTVCDMSKVPLKDNSIDIAVFCLSLMGTNLNDYLSEASRVLKKGGTLKIAEVASRFQSSSIARFIIGVEQYGFQFIQKDTTNKMFVMMDFKKTKSPKASLTELQLDPCVYKKR